MTHVYEILTSHNSYYQYLYLRIPTFLSDFHAVNIRINSDNCTTRPADTDRSGVTSAGQRGTSTGQTSRGVSVSPAVVSVVSANRSCTGGTVSVHVQGGKLLMN